MASLKKRGKTYYAQYYIGTQQIRKNLYTENLQIAKEKLRQLESALYRQVDIPLPTRTTVEKVVGDYVDHLYTVKRNKNAQKDISYLRDTFGPICDQLRTKNQKMADKSVKRKAIHPINPIQAVYFEQITTEDISRFIASVVRSKGIKPKTANRYREILTRLFNWATTQRGIVLPGAKNPAAAVDRYKEADPEILYLSLKDIEEQLAGLADTPQLQAMVAVYIYAGLRREEAVWLTTANIDLDSGPYGMIHIVTKSIGDKDWHAKTLKKRVVPISSQLRPYLDRYTPIQTEENWFFPSPKGEWWDPDNFSADLRERNKKLGLKWSCDEYRHTFGSQLARKGESLYKISKMMGNSPEICRKHYASLLPDALIDSVEFPVEGEKAVYLPQPMLPEPDSVVRQEPVEEPRLRLVVNNR